MSRIAFDDSAQARSGMNERRFISLWERCIGSPGKAVFDQVDARYREPHRCYHGPAHVEHCLRELDEAGTRVPNRDAVEMALWFHDVIYDVPEVPAPDNEQRSAEFFGLCAGRGGTGRFRADVRRLILITEHRVLPEAEDERFMIDIDLSSFGVGWSEFLRNSRAVRLEQPQVPDDRFHAGIQGFMRGMLARPRFCFTAFFRARHEQAAIDNINRYLAMPQPVGQGK